MATTSESTMTHARRMSAGCLCATALTGRVPDEPTQEWLYDRTDWPSTPVASLPLPPANAVAEALDHIARGAADPSIYQLARAQLAAGVPIAFDGITRWVDGVAVEMAPEGLRWPWPWCCACRAERCWHAALCDGLVLAEQRLLDEAGIASVGRSPQHWPSYTTLLLISGLSLLILWRVRLPTAEQNQAVIGVLSEAARALVVGR